MRAELVDIEDTGVTTGWEYSSVGTDDCEAEALDADGAF